MKIKEFNKVNFKTNTDKSVNTNLYAPIWLVIDTLINYRTQVSLTIGLGQKSKLPILYSKRPADG